MRLRQPGNLSPWPAPLSDLARHLRALRAFDAAAVLGAKQAVLDDFFARSGRDTAVVGLSGGVDSALVLALLASVMRRPGSALKRVIPMLLPCRDNDGVTGQAAGAERARKAAAACGLTPVEIDMGPLARVADASLTTALGGEFTPWSRGQAVACLRTPLLYAATAWGADRGWTPVVVGTTNRDEGAYLGYVGKASDGMVDVQPIADLHKSEVRALAVLLGVPAEIVAVEPTGDLYDGQPDEALFGAPYAFVELYLGWKTLDAGEQASLWASLDGPSRERFEVWGRSLERLHGYNAHKYRVGSPAVALDVLDSAVPGGARPPCPEPYRVRPHLLESSSAWSGAMALPVCPRRPWFASSSSWKARPVPTGPEGLGGTPWLRHWSGVLTPEGLRALSEASEATAGVPAGDDGRWGSYRSGQPVHCDRSAAWEEAASEALWALLRPLLPPFRVFADHPDTDANGWRVWRPVGVSPVWRFLRYRKESRLIPHYDAPFEEGPRRRTLTSALLYLRAVGDGGALRFLNDPQRMKPWAERVWRDQPDNDAPSWHAVQPAPGDLVLFDHRLLHDSAPLGVGAYKTVIRTDIVWEAVGAAPRLPEEHPWNGP